MPANYRPYRILALTKTDHAQSRGATQILSILLILSGQIGPTGPTGCPLLSSNHPLGRINIKHRGLQGQKWWCCLQTCGWSSVWMILGPRDRLPCFKMEGLVLSSLEELGRRAVLVGATSVNLCLERAREGGRREVSLMLCRSRRTEWPCCVLCAALPKVGSSCCQRVTQRESVSVSVKNKSPPDSWHGTAAHSKRASLALAEHIPTCHHKLPAHHKLKVQPIQRTQN